MCALEGPVKELDEKYAESIVKFVSEVRSGKVEGSNKVACATLTLLELIINDAQNVSAFELVSLVRCAGRRLQRALPQQPAAANVARRLLKAIRDETRHSQQSGGGGCAGAGGGGAAGAAGGGGESLQRLVLAAPARRATLSHRADLREPLRDHIAELRLELETSSSTICSMSLEHVHGDELILSVWGELVERFFMVCLERRYRLILAETAHHVAQTHSMARRLAAAGVQVTVIGNESVSAVMSRVNKVVVCADAVLAGGAALADVGTHAVTLAATHYAVPVIVLAALYKLSPHFASEPRVDAALSTPAHTALYESECVRLSRVFSPRHDLLPAGHVTLFITNLGGSSPSYIYRLLSELYDPNDYQL